ncbi:enoyl-CoA hydratase/isomerase family protein [Paracoccus yeei]|uniref:enoyl-CoA hydratase/isomerase family protein n=1 Tax=Paracoccus yeei TaxID=147645 RepID=UPI003BF7C1BB
MSMEMDIVVEGRVGRLRLNRPKALHSLNVAMCTEMLHALLAWRDDPAIDLVMVDHAQGRGFCAGGDVRAAALSGAGDGREARDFFATEYRVDHLLFTYPKPTVAFMDGITIGGGVGLSQPCHHRIATAATSLAMPESGIGLFTDAGGGWYLSRLPGRVGQWLALTGSRLDADDCCALGLADHYLDAAQLDQVKRDLVARPTDAPAILAAAQKTPPPSSLDALRPQIDRLFAADRYEDILAALDADGGDWARDQRAILASKSNVTAKVSLRLLVLAADLTDFAQEMRQEYRIASRICRGHDFREGVRAVLVDKDNAPRWHPATPEGVDDSMIDDLFAPLPEAEEWRPAPEDEGRERPCNTGLVQ